MIRDDDERAALPLPDLPCRFGARFTVPDGEVFLLELSVMMSFGAARSEMDCAGNDFLDVDVDGAHGHAEHVADGKANLPLDG